MFSWTIQGTFLKSLPFVAFIDFQWCYSLSQLPGWKKWMQLSACRGCFPTQRPLSLRLICHLYKSHYLLSGFESVYLLLISVIYNLFIDLLSSPSPKSIYQGVPHVSDLLLAFWACTPVNLVHLFLNNFFFKPFF